MGKSVLAIISEDTPLSAVSRLQKSFVTISLPADPLLAPPVASHPDMLITIIDHTLFCHENYYTVASAQIDAITAMCHIRLVCTTGPRGPEYPGDVGLNTLVLRDRRKLIAKRASLAPELLPYLAADTKQGYAGCSSLYVKGTILTADPSICWTAERLGIPVCALPYGEIVLPGYDTGLIGGCGGVCNNTVYLYGNTGSCTPGRALKLFCHEANISIVELMDAPLSDFGGIQFIEIKKALYI